MSSSANNDCADLQEVEIDQRALVNILSRYPGAFDILRELIQNADDADASCVEIHFQTGEAENSQPTSVPDSSMTKVRKWIIKNDGGGFREKDWERLGTIASGNDNSSKVGAFGVGFYSVLSKSDQPLVMSNGKSLQFERGKDGKLRKRSGSCNTDSWTSIELELRDPEPSPPLADLTKFLVSSVAFLARIQAISVHLDSRRVLSIRKEVQSTNVVEIPQHLRSSTPLKSLTVKSVQRIVQKIVVDAEEYVFASSLTTTSTLPIVGDDDLIERSGRSEGRAMRVSRNVDAIQENNTITHDLYKAVTCVNLNDRSEMKKSVESSMKSLPTCFECKALYFNCDQSLAGVDNSHSPKAQRLARLFCGSQGIFPGDDRHVIRGRLFIGQSTNQTTGIGLHISAHFLPTMERGTIDLANGYIKAWNKEVLHVGGFLARIIYEEEMQVAAKARRDRVKHLGLCTMDRFAFGTTVPHSGVSQILQEAFFSCSNEPRSPLPVVSDAGISCLSLSEFRTSRSLSFLETYRILHEEVEPRQRSEIINRYKITGFKFGDIVREFENGVSEDAMGAFFTWWEDTNNPRSLSSLPSKNARINFCEEFASRCVLRLNRGTRIEFKNIKYFIFFPIPDDLSPPDTIYIDNTWGVSTKASVECFGWTQLPLLRWLRYACSQARQLDFGQDSHRDSDVGYRILRAIVQFAFVEYLTRQQWHEAAELMKNLRCIPTNMGRELPDNAYFDEHAVCGGLPIVKEAEFLNIPPTPVAFGGSFEYRSVDMRHVREVLISIRIRAMMDWGDMIQKLEIVASEETNYRLLYLTIFYLSRMMPMEQYVSDLKGRRVFYSEKHGHASASELLLPNDDVRNLGLPVLALPQNGIATLQGSVDRFVSIPVESLIVYLGIQRYPRLDRIIAQAASDKAEIRRPALHYLLTNLEKHYKAYKSDDFAEVAFIPTKSGSLARPNEVFASSVWEELGFKQISDDLRRDFARLGVKEDPPIDKVIEYLVTPERTLPDLKTATTWFKLLYLHGKFPITKLREQLSKILFVPVENPGSAPSESSSIQYICPKDCFIMSAETKKHHREIFTFVDFGQDGNNFLESCCAKKSPNASDIVSKILQGPQEYLKAVGNIDHYREDLRTIASQLDSVSMDDKQAMMKTPMFLAERNGKVAEELLTAEKVFIRDWVGGGFRNKVFIAPKDDVLEKMYRKMGSAFLGTCVRFVVTIDNPVESKPLFDCGQVILRIRSFMNQRDESLKTGVLFDGEDPTYKLEVKVCEDLTWEKTFVPPFGFLPDPAAPDTETKSMRKKAGFKRHEDDNSYTLWLVNIPSESADLHKELLHDIALALCHTLLKNYGYDDVLLLASLFAMKDDRIRKYYPNEPKSGRDTKDESKDTSKVEFQLPLPPFVPKRFGTPGARGRKTVGKQFIPPEEDAATAVASLNPLVLDSEAVGPGVPVQLVRPTTGKKQNYCKRAYAIRLRERKELQEEATQIKFFLARDAKCQQPPLHALREFAELVLNLAAVFDIKDVPATCFIFWKDTDDDLMAFNRDQKFLLFNLAHYYKFFYNKVERKRTIIDWYLIMAHEIAHVWTMEHDEYHGSLSAEYAVHHLPDLYNHFSDIVWGTPKQQQQQEGEQPQSA